VAVEIVAAQVPLIEGVQSLVSRHRSGGMATNRTHFGDRVRMGASIPRDLQDLLFDPQTSGGLLIAVSEEAGPALTAALENAGVPVRQIGRVVARTDDKPLISVV
jgi:selenide,water dikinase